MSSLRQQPSAVQISKPPHSRAKQKNGGGDGGLYSVHRQSSGDWCLRVLVHLGRVVGDPLTANANTGQYLAFPGVLGNGMASRTLERPVTYATVRSKPRPNPACGTVP